MKFVTGQVLILESGEYSDYGIVGVMLVLRDFDQKEAVDAFRKQWRPREDIMWDDPEPGDFVAWLSKEGYVRDAKEESVRWVLGTYGFNPEIS